MEKGKDKDKDMYIKIENKAQATSTLFSLIWVGVESGEAFTHASGPHPSSSQLSPYILAS